MQAYFQIGDLVATDLYNLTVDKIVDRQLMFVDHPKYLQREWVYICEKQPQLYYKEEYLYGVEKLKREIQTTKCVLDYYNTKNLIPPGEDCNRLKLLERCLGKLEVAHA